MDIKAAGQLDLSAFKALQKAHKGAMYYISIMLIGIAVGEFLFELMFLGVAESFRIGWPLLVVAVVLALLIFAAPRLSYRQLGRLKDAVSEYEFGDEGFKVVSRQDGMETSGQYSYDMIEKVVELPEYIFIYQTKNAAFPIEKATIEGGTAEDIRAIFAPRLGKKYIVRKG